MGAKQHVLVTGKTGTGKTLVSSPSSLSLSALCVRSLSLSSLLPSLSLSLSFSQSWLLCPVQVLTHKLTHDPGELVTPLFLMFSARTSAAGVQDAIDATLERRRKGVFGPARGTQVCHPHRALCYLNPISIHVSSSARPTGRVTMDAQPLSHALTSD
jgi:hypothetical protein